MASSALRLSEFASVERANTGRLARQTQMVSETPYLRKHFDAIPYIVLVLNQHRQIIFANRATLTLLNPTSREALYGLRPGEALGCIHADEPGHGGCGTTAFCRECGAVKSILSALDGQWSVQECRITPKSGAPLDMSVTASPYGISTERFVVFVVADISDKKRREVLERIFFHDVSNAMSVLLGSAELLTMQTPEQDSDLAQQILTAARTLTSEVRAQEQLLLAEDARLSLRPADLHSLAVLQEIVSMYARHDHAETKSIEIDDSAVDVAFTCDKMQLSRIIENMLKNALEASSPGQSVQTGCDPVDGDIVRFWVRNSQHIPKNAQLQIFNRSFSTKGVGRGIGTYSMKLLGEKYLKGKVAFKSSPETGTTFSLTLPIKNDPQA
jgi:nitrogen fixation/metabolism regulation signal transduction histidine kinase